LGIIGTFIANFSGKYIDQGYIHKISICCGLGSDFKLVVIYFIAVFFCLLCDLTILIYSCLSAVHVTNQSIVFKLNQQLRSRFNAIYMTGYFTGGAVGTTAGSYAWRHFG
jgi:hypothetical protein